MRHSGHLTQKVMSDMAISNVKAIQFSKSETCEHGDRIYTTCMEK